MRVLDLFCGAGGAAMGYHRAGFDEIVGVDIEPQPNYPFTFIQGDALKPAVDLDAFDLIHASPPCQAFSVATPENHDHPDLVDETRQLLAGRPSVIENVWQAPLRRDIRLCGSMFGLQVQRHRAFELSRFGLVLTPACNHKEWAEGRPVTVAGHVDGPQGRFAKHHLGVASADHAADLMGMPRGMPMASYTEAIPPAYTEYIGTQFLDQS
jgi:DNA (cytosine-5)-methyltransferase 1